MTRQLKITPYFPASVICHSLLVVRSTESAGNIKLNVSSQGMKTQSLTIKTIK